MPVYYGGDLCDSDESDWDDPYDIACVEYVEQYNFDAIEGMELNVFERCKRPDKSAMVGSEWTGPKYVRQTSSSYPRCELDMVGVESLIDVFMERYDVPDAAVSPNVRNCSDTYDGGTALYDEGDISDSDGVSIEDCERDTWEDWCDSALRNGFGEFPPDRDDLQPTVVFSDKLFSDEVFADTPVSVHEEVPVSALQIFMDVGLPLVPPVIDWIVRRSNDELSL